MSGGFIFIRHYFFTEMSKTTVKKSLEGFDAGELRQLILDIYTKSKEAKEILDFYAVPDIAKKLDEYKKTILKEVQRYVRRAHRPRIPRIRATIKKLSILDPGDEAVGELMAFSILELCKVATHDTLNDSTNNAIDKLFTETLTHLQSRLLLHEYEPIFAKSIREMNDFRYYANPLKQLLGDTLASFQK